MSPLFFVPELGGCEPEPLVLLRVNRVVSMLFFDGMRVFAMAKSRVCFYGPAEAARTAA
jgi:hypothetical protein